MEKSKALPWTTYETTFQFIEATDAHRAILKEERVAYHQVADMLICMKPLTQGDYLILEEVNCNRYAFKRFLLAEYMERKVKSKVEEKAVVVQPSTVEEVPEVQEMLKKWKWTAPWLPSSERSAWKKEIEFSPEVMRSCVEHGLEWRLYNNYIQITCKKGVENKDGWVVHNPNTPSRLVKSSNAMERDALKKQGKIWIEVEDVLFFETKVHDLPTLQSFHAAMKTLRNYIREYEGQQKMEKAKATIPVDTLLQKSNFYDVIHEQLEVNPEQTTFVFHRLSDPVQQEAFDSAVGRSGYTTRSFLFSGKPIVCLKSTDGEFVKNWDDFTLGLFVVQFLVFILFCIMSAILVGSRLFSITLEKPQEAWITFTGAGCATLVGFLLDAFLYLGTNLYVERRAKPLLLNIH